MHRDQCQTLLLVPCLMYLCRTKGFCTVLKASHDEQLHDVTCASLEAFPFFCVVTSCIVMSIAWCNLRVEMGMCYCWQCQSVALSDSATVAEHLWLVVTTTVWKPVQSHLHTACSWQIPAWSDPVYQINTQTSNPVNIVHIHRDQCQTPALWSLALATYTRYMHNNIMHMCESIDTHKLHPELALGRLLCQPTSLDPDLLRHTEVIEESRNKDHLYRKVFLKNAFLFLMMLIGAGGQVWGPSMLLPGCVFCSLGSPASGFCWSPVQSVHNRSAVDSVQEHSPTCDHYCSVCCTSHLCRPLQHVCTCLQRTGKKWQDKKGGKAAQCSMSATCLQIKK